jgi:hypothetical protein
MRLEGLGKFIRLIGSRTRDLPACRIVPRPHFTRNNWLYGAEHYSIGHQLCSHKIVSEHFMEPEGSLPHSQELPTCPYPEPDQSSLHHLIRSLQDPPTCFLAFLVASIPLAFPPIIYTRFSCPPIGLHVALISSSLV